MNASRARGGPLDGIRIDAEPRWDGRVRQSADGRYVWRDAAWHWEVNRKLGPIPRRKKT